MPKNKYVSWLLCAGFAVAGLGTTFGSLRASDLSSFKELQARVRDEGVDQVADELLKEAEGELEQRIAGTLDMCRPILRAHPEQLWHQLAWRNREGGEEFAKFLGAPPAGPLLSVRTPSLKQYTPGVINSAFGPQDKLLAMRLTDDGEHLICAFVDSLRILDADDFSEVERFSSAAPYRRTGWDMFERVWIGEKPGGEFILSEVPLKEDALQLAQWSKASQGVFDANHILHGNAALAPDNATIIGRDADGRLVAQRIDGSGGPVILGGADTPEWQREFCLKFVAAGKHLLALDGLGQIGLFDWKTGESVRPAQLPARGVTACALSDDGRWLAIARSLQVVDGEARPRIVLWNVADWKLEAEWTDPEPANIFSLAFRGKSNEVISAVGDTLKVWRVGAVEPVQTLEAPTALLTLQPDRQGERLYARTSAWGLIEFDLDKLPKAAARRHLESVRQVTLAGNEQVAASIGGQGELMLWDVAKSAWLRRREILRPVIMSYGRWDDRPISFSPDDSSVLIGGFEEDRPICMKWELNGAWTSLPVADAKLIVPPGFLAMRGGELYDQVTRQVQPMFMPGGRRVLCPQLSNNPREYAVLDSTSLNRTGQISVTLGKDDGPIGAAETWEAFGHKTPRRELTVVNILNGEKKSFSLSVIPDRCAVGEDGHPIAVIGPLEANKWGIEFVDRGSGKSKIVELPHSLDAIAANRAGSVLFTGSDNGDLKLWDVEQARCVQTVALDSPITSIALGERVAAIGDAAGKVHFIEYAMSGKQ